MIKYYQNTPSITHGYCKHIPTCSDYTIEALNEYGLVKGGYKSIKRIIKCNPFNKGGYDPIKKEVQNDKK